MNASWFIAGKMKLFPWPQKPIQCPYQLNPHPPTTNQWDWLSFLLTHSSPSFISQLVPQVKRGLDQTQDPREPEHCTLHVGGSVWVPRPPVLSLWPGSSQWAEDFQFVLWNGSLNNSGRYNDSCRHRTETASSQRPPMPHLLTWNHTLWDIQATWWSAAGKN